MKEFIKKICMCGDPGVGKTSLIRQFVSGKYDEKYISTLGTVVTKKVMFFPKRRFKLNMQIWDISGQAEFKRIHASAFRRADGAIAVCDMLDPRSAGNLREWISNLHLHARSKIPVVILVNKSDLAGNDRNHLKKIEPVISKLGYPVITTSAKTGYHVEDGFRQLGREVVLNFDTLPKPSPDLTVMPEIFESPFIFMDYVTMRFSTSFGDEEIGMHMMRKQLEADGIDFRDLSGDDALRMIDRLADIMGNFKGEEEARNLRMQFIEAYKRCCW